MVFGASYVFASAEVDPDYFTLISCTFTGSSSLPTTTLWLPKFTGYWEIGEVIRSGSDWILDMSGLWNQDMRVWTVKQSGSTFSWETMDYRLAGQMSPYAQNWQIIGVNYAAALM